MRAPYSVPGTFVLLLFLLVPQSGHSLLISGTGTWGIFEGSITYNCEQASGEGTLIVELTNTSPADNGGYLTGFAFNNPGGCVAGVTFSDADFELLGAPSFADGVSAVPLGHFDIGAAPHNKSASILLNCTSVWWPVPVNFRRHELFSYFVIAFI